MNRRYDIEPRSAKLGGGWSLKLFDGSDEMGGGVFPRVETPDQPHYDQAYQDALEEGEQWVST